MPTSRLSRRSFLSLAGSATGAALVPALASCGNSGNSGTATGTKTFSWQAIPAYSVQASDPSRAQYVRQQLSAFQQHSGYHVSAQVSSADITSAMAKLLEQAAQHRTPAVAQIDSYIFPRFASYAQSIASELRAAGLALGDWFPPFRKGMTSSGEPKGMQFTTDVRVLYYRKDIVGQPPATFAEVISAGRKLKAENLAFIFPGGRGEGALSCTVWPPYWAAGDSIITGGKAGFASGKAHDDMLAVLSHVENCISSGITPKRVSTYAQEDDILPEVAGGRAGMFIGGNWQVAELEKITPGGNFAERWGVAPIPNAAGSNFATLAGGWVWGFFDPAASARKEEAKFIIDGWVSDVGMASWCNIGGYLPPRQSVYDSPKYKGNAFTPVFRRHLSQYAQERPADAAYQDISNAMQVAVSSVASGQQSAEKALASALAQIG